MKVAILLPFFTLSSAMVIKPVSQQQLLEKILQIVQKQQLLNLDFETQDELSRSIRARNCRNLVQKHLLVEHSMMMRMISRCPRLRDLKSWAQDRQRYLRQTVANKGRQSHRH